MTFRAESERNPSGMALDSGLKVSEGKGSEGKEQNNPLGIEPVTRGVRRDWLDSLAEVVSVLRPDWSVAGIRASIGRSQAAPRDRILNAIAAADDGVTNTPGRIEFYDRRRPTPIPDRYVAEHVDVAPMPAEILAVLADLKPLPQGRR